MCAFSPALAPDLFTHAFSPGLVLTTFVDAFRPAFVPMFVTIACSLTVAPK